MKSVVKLISVISLLYYSTAFAHVPLKNSSPYTNETLTNSPKQLSLTFGSAVWLTKLSVSDSNGEKVDFGFKPPKKSVVKAAWDLPPLSSSSYEVKMVFLGQDGHKMKESFNFIVH